MNSLYCFSQVLYIYAYAASSRVASVDILKGQKSSSHFGFRYYSTIRAGTLLRNLCIFPYSTAKPSLIHLNIRIYLACPG